MPFPTRRLVGVFGSDLEEVDAPAMARLIGQVEDSDLEFKASMYGNRDADRIEAAKDVAAFANLGGGLIVLGVTDTDGSATALTPWEASEGDELRIREIATERVVPYLDISIQRVVSGEAEKSFMLIVVPASTDAPHGVRQGDSLKFPVRDGRRTRYMAEAEIALAYRRRFAAFEDRERRLEEVHSGGVAHLFTDSAWLRPWLTVSLVPLRPAGLSLDASTRDNVERQFKEAVALSCPNTPFTGRTFLQGRVGVREVQVTDSNTFVGSPRSSFAVLHADGSAFVAAGFWSGGNNFGAQDDEFHIARDSLTVYVLGVLELACKHAVASGVSGDAILAVDIVVPDGDFDRRLVLVRAGSIPPPAAGWPPLAPSFAGSRYTVPLPAVTDSGPELVAASFQMLADLEAGFGQPEPMFVRRDGSISPQLGAIVGDWPTIRGIELA